jgi:hypothetical protein
VRYDALELDDVNINLAIGIGATDRGTSSPTFVDLELGRRVLRTPKRRSLDSVRGASTRAR